MEFVYQHLSTNCLVQIFGMILLQDKSVFNNLFAKRLTPALMILDSGINNEFLFLNL